MISRDAAKILDDLAKGLKSLPTATALAVLESQEALERQQGWASLEPAIWQGPYRKASDLFLFHELKAQHRLVPFVGAKLHKLRDSLVEWARGLKDAEGLVGLRWLCGPGGSGKTRLVVEAAYILQSEGWQVGFVPHGLRHDEAKQYAPHWTAPPKPTLLVVDYADARDEEFIFFILDAAIKNAEVRRYPLGLLFLSRSNPSEDQGLKNMLDDWSTKGLEPLRAVLIREFRIERLPSLEDNERRELFLKSVDAFRERLGISDRNGAVNYTDQQLPSRPLPVILLGFLAAQGRHVTESDDELAVFRAIWNWERRKWREILYHRLKWEGDLLDAGVERLEEAAVAATLGRPFYSKEEVVEFWRNHPSGDDLLEGKEIHRLAGCLSRIFPLIEERSLLVSPIEPDPLADFVLLQREDLPELLESALPSVEKVWDKLEELDAQLRETPQEVSIPESIFWPAYTVAQVLPRLMAMKIVEKDIENVTDGIENIIKVFYVFQKALEIVSKSVKAIAPWLERINKGLLEAAGGERSSYLWAEVWDWSFNIFRLYLFKSSVRSFNNVSNVIFNLCHRKEMLELMHELVKDCLVELDLLDSLLFNLDLDKIPLNFSSKEETLKTIMGLAKKIEDLGRMLIEAGYCSEGAKAFEGGLRILIPCLRLSPQAFTQLAMSLQVNYLKTCKAVEMAPDWDLLAEIESLFLTVQDGEDPQSEQ